MEKIAICLFGLVGGSRGKNGDGTPVEIDYARKGFESCLSNHYQVDYYIHSWSIEASEALKKLYQPIQILCEEPMPYDEKRWLKKIKERATFRQKARNLFSHSWYQKEALAAFRAKSRWTSTKRSIDLIGSDDLQKYSYVISARLDLEFLNPFIIPENLEPSELLVSHWNDAVIEGNRGFNNQLNYSESKKGFMDLWFAGRPNAVAKFSRIADEFESYDYSPHISSYSHTKAVGLKARYFLYRGYDYELVRRKRYKATE